MFHHEEHWYDTPADVLKGAITGAIGGFVASWVMEKFQEATKPPTAVTDNGAARRDPERVQQRQQEAEQQQQAAREATVKTAEAVSRKLFDRPLSGPEKRMAGPAVHYIYGTAVGGLYGAVSELWPLLDVGFGMGYGMALWALGNEAAVPALRLGPPPTEASPTQHADALAAHLVYGIALDVTRRVARHIL